MGTDLSDPSVWRKTNRFVLTPRFPRTFSCCRRADLSRMAPTFLCCAPKNSPNKRGVPTGYKTVSWSPSHGAAILLSFIHARHSRFGEAVQQTIQDGHVNSPSHNELRLISVLTEAAILATPNPSLDNALASGGPQMAPHPGREPSRDWHPENQ